MQYEYKTEYGVFTKGKKDKEVSAQFDDFINRNAAEGWEYYNTITITEIVKAGCLAAFIGAQNTSVQHSLLVFRKVK